MPAKIQSWTFEVNYSKTSKDIGKEEASKHYSIANSYKVAVSPDGTPTAVCWSFDLQNKLKDEMGASEIAKLKEALVENASEKRESDFASAEEDLRYPGTKFVIAVDKVSCLSTSFLLLLTPIDILMVALLGQAPAQVGKQHVCWQGQ